jgi:hypothetical protein
MPILSGQNKYNNPGTLLVWRDLGGFYGGLAVLDLPNINSQNDGLLFTVSNDEGGSLRGNYANNAPRADGSGWDVAIRGIEESKSDPTAYVADNLCSFSFLYVPFNADNLIGGHVNGNGAVVKGAGSFTVSRLSTGRYALTIPGKTGSDGALLLQNSGYMASQPTVVDTSFMSYEYGGTDSPSNAFIIEARAIDPAANNGVGAAVLRDAGFNFVFVDFLNPLAPPGTVRPVLSISRTDASHVVVSWNNGPGFILQTNNSLLNEFGAGPYRYYRFVPTALRDGASANSVQIAEFQLLANGVPLPGAIPSNPGGSSPGNEGPAQANDGSLSTKWLDFTKFNPLVLDFGAPVNADAYRLATANDADERDPVSWRVEGSTDNVNWITLDTQTRYPVPNARQTYLPNFSLPVGGWSDVGAANPSAPIAIGATPLFFRCISP